MNEDDFNTSVRKFLKKSASPPSARSRRRCEMRVASGKIKGNETLPAKMTLTVGGVGLSWTRSTASDRAGIEPAVTASSMNVPVFAAATVLAACVSCRSCPPAFTRLPAAVTSAARAEPSKPATRRACCGCCPPTPSPTSPSR